MERARWSVAPSAQPRPELELGSDTDPEDPTLLCLSGHTDLRRVISAGTLLDIYPVLSGDIEGELCCAVLRWRLHTLRDLQLISANPPPQP